MKEIAKKYLKCYNEICMQFAGEIDHDWWEVAEFNMVFGYLVLEYFPAHGIFVVQNSISWKWEVWNLLHHNSLVEEDLDPQKAIEKAFSIREKQLEGK